MTEIEGIGKEVDDSLKLEENSDRGTCWKRRKEVEKGEQRRLKTGKKAIMKELTARLEKSGAMKFDVERGDEEKRLDKLCDACEGGNERVDGGGEACESSRLQDS